MTKFLKILFVLPLFFLSGCKDDNNNVITMATSADYAPFEFYQEQEITGFDIELAKIITANLGYELKIVDMDFAGIIPALQTAKVDFAMSAINPTPQRAKNVDFSDVYYSNDASFLYLKDGFNDDLLNFQDKKFGVQSGSVFEEFLLDQQKSFPSIQIHSVSKIPLLVEELKLKRIDAILLDNQIAKTMQPNVSGAAILDVSGFNFGAVIAFPQGKKDLVDAFNAEIKRLIDNGQIDELKARWFVSAPAVEEVGTQVEEVKKVEVIEMQDSAQPTVELPIEPTPVSGAEVKADSIAAEENPQAINLEERVKEEHTSEKDSAHMEQPSSAAPTASIEEAMPAIVTVQK